MRARHPTEASIWSKNPILLHMIHAFPGDIWLIQALQSLGDWPVPVMKFFTWLGYPQAYMLLIAVLYWSVDRKLGLRLALFLPVVASLNSLLKQGFHAPRPYWLDPDIRAILPSNGFGMPSGHAQASTVWLYAASLLKNRGFWILAVMVVFMIGLSRVYLGVHFPSQVLLGWVTGILVLLIFYVYETRVLTWFLGLRFSRQLLWISGSSLLLLLLGGLILLVTRNWEMPLEWIANAADDLADGEIIRTSVGLNSVAGNSGGFLGAALGALLSHRRGGFNSGGIAWKRVARAVTGLVVLIGCYGFLQWAAPDPTRQLLYGVWRFGGFFVLSFTAMHLVPLLFQKLGLSS